MTAADGEPLAGRVAIVTGVSRRVGIAWTIARRLVEDGARVLATGWPAHDAAMPWGADDRGTSIVDAVDGEDRSRLDHVEVDLSEPVAAADLVGRARQRFGRIDIVVAAHARNSHDGLTDVTAEELDACWAVNARAGVLLAQALRIDRPPGPGGRLVLFTSGQHIAPMADELAYAISKGAVHQMTASLSDALIERGVTVNCVNPGPVDTGWAAGATVAEIAAMFPAGRWGTPDDVAGLVAWLASDDGSWMTGQVLDNEGGFRRWARPAVDRG